MFKLKKGDIWKALVLVILIAAVCLFAYWRVSEAISRPAHPGTILAKQGAASEFPEETSSGEELFATRPRTTPSELAKARTTPDPFRPDVADRGTTRAPAPAAVSQNGAPPSTGFWLTGVIYSERPLAILREGEQHYFVRRGESLPGGWKVTSIGRRDITLTKADQKISLQVSSPPASWPSFSR